MARTPDESEGVDEMGRYINMPYWYDGSIYQEDGRREAREGKPLRERIGQYPIGYEVGSNMPPDLIDDLDETRLDQITARGRRDQESQ